MPYKVDYFKTEIKLSENESILFAVCEGNILEAKNAKRTIPRKTILDYYYLSKVNKLNELLIGIERLKRMDENE